jgi:replicative DNA helicase
VSAITSPHVPPSNMDAEAVVLAAVMSDEQALDQLQHMLRPEHFYADANRTIYSAALDLAKVGKPTDLVGVATLLRDRDQLERVGGSSYLAGISGSPFTNHVAEPAKDIVAKARLRALIREAQTIVAEAYAVPENVGAFVQSAEARMYAAAGEGERELRARSAREIMGECIPEITRRFRGQAPAGHSTGFSSLDLRIGGIRKGRVYVIAARPGMGKTSLVTQIMGSVATSKADDRGVYMASLEMPREQIGERLLAQDAALDTRKVERGWLNREEWDSILTSGKGVGGWPLVVDDQSGMTLSVLRSSLRRARRRMESEFGVGLGLVCIDYFQLLSTSDVSRWGSSTNDQLEALSKGIADGIAKEFDVPVLLLSQLNRECEKRPNKRPQLSDLRGSGALEQDAHTILFLYREDQYRKDGEARDRSAEVIVAKARGGRCGTVNLSYLEYCTKFVDEQSDDADDELAKYQHEIDALSVDMQEGIEARYP